MGCSFRPFDLQNPYVICKGMTFVSFARLRQQVRMESISAMAAEER